MKSVSSRRQLEEVFVILEQRKLPPKDAFAEGGDGLWVEAVK